MAHGKNHRTDSRRSSSYCSTVTLVVFVAFCLVGVWMLTSFTVVPVEMYSSRSEVKDQVSDADSKPFEDSSGDVPEVTVKENTIIDEEKTSKSTAELPDQKLSEKSTVNSADSTQGDKDVSFDTSKPQTYSDESGTGEGGEMAKPAEGLNTVGGDPNTEGRKNKQNEIAEQNTDEITSNKPEENKARDADQEAKNEQNNNSEENSMESIGNKERKQSDIDNSSTESQKQQSDNENNYGETVGDDKQQINSEKDSKSTNRDEVQQSNNSVNSEQEIFSDVESVQGVNDLGQINENMEQNQIKDAETNNGENKINGQLKNQGSNEVFPNGALSDLLNETNTTNGAWSTQAEESRNEKEVQTSSLLSWKTCNVTAGADYIPCLDNEQAIKKLPSTKHYEHRERHCPEEGPTCLVPLPNGYQRPIEWPSSREKIWYHNVPHTRLAVVKGHQNWVKVNGDHLIFPGGGTQFKHGALHYIDFIQESTPDIAWGKQSRVVLDVGCGVASFGGFLFDRDTLTMSFAPKDEHEAQVQFALERGIPAILAVMGTKRLPFPGRVFDVIHCARCRVPWHIEGGILLAELDRLLRPGGYFVWSATPVYQKNQEDQEVWNAMSALTKAMCWEMVAKRRDTINHVGLAIFKKPLDNLCYGKRKQNKPPLCQESDDPNAAWNIPLQACLHNLPVDIAGRGLQWPEQWPQRLEKTPYWLNSSQIGVYGKPASEDFQEDYKHWKRIVSQSYMTGMGINWSTVRNVMDMRSVYGGFAAALRDMNVWVMNVVSIGSPDTLPIIYERGLFGIYHDWCESFNTYPRTYDLLHADHLFSRIKRCKILSVFVEVDRMLRPEGKLIVRDTKKVINELEGIAISLNWEIRMTYAKDNEGLLCVQKTMWRPKDVDGNTKAV